jgi:surface protein
MAAFTSVWSIPSGGSDENRKVILPIILDTTLNNITVNWGDGNINNYNNNFQVTNENRPSRIYTSGGDKTITITGAGKLSGWSFGGGLGTPTLLKSITQYGNLELADTGSQFRNCTNLVTFPQMGTLTLTGNCDNMFNGCIKLNTNLNTLITTNVTTMSGMFNGCTLFNGNIADWNVQSVKTMDSMFLNCSQAFTGAFIFALQTGNVVDSMANMFSGCTLFTGNENLQNWNVRRVTTMENMFLNCSLAFTGEFIFNVPTDREVTNMANMFSGCFRFNGDISNWSVNTVNNMTGIFTNCNAFRTDISQWVLTGISFNRAPTFSTAYIDHPFSPLFDNWTFRTDLNNTIQGLTDCIIPAERKYKYSIITTTPGLLKLSLNKVFRAVWFVNTLQDRIILPIISGTPLSIYINWGYNAADIHNYVPYNDTVDDENRPTSLAYANGGDKTVTVTGELPGWTFRNGVVTLGTPALLKSITLYGGLVLHTTGSQFKDCTILETFPTLDGLGVTDLTLPAICTSMFEGCTSLNTDLRTLNTTQVTNMSNMFKGCTQFNGNISTWNVQNVLTMDNMFLNCLQYTGANIFNVPINRSVTNMSNMFNGCTPFNGNISTWNVQLVTDMSSMFKNCSQAFTGANIFALLAQNVVDSMANMFSGCSAFIGNENLKNWNVQSVTTMENMFLNCSQAFTGAFIFRVPTDSSVTNMANMFSGCTLFNGGNNMDNWDVQRVLTMDSMFLNCLAFLGYSIFELPAGNVVNTMANMFSGCNAFIGNENLKNWNVQSVTTMENMFLNSFRFTGEFIFALLAPNVVDSMANMFSGCTLFTGNENLKNWNVQSVKRMDSMFLNCSQAFTGANIFSVPINSSVTNMANMFSGCTIFNGNTIANWDVQRVTDMSSMFLNCSQAFTGAFIFALLAPNVVDSMANMFSGCTLFTGNENLKNWNVQSVKRMDSMFLNCSQAFTGANIFSVPINSSVTNMANMFSGCTLFNGNNIANWDVQRVTDMSSMFKNCSHAFTGANIFALQAGNVVDTMANMFNGCTLFNGNIANWDVRLVKTMENMFNGCTPFNGNIANWDVRLVNTMENMFTGCGAFRTDISKWVLTGITNNKAPTFSPQYIDDVKPLFSAEYPNAWTFRITNTNNSSILNVIISDATQRSLYRTRQLAESGNTVIKLDRTPFVSNWTITAANTVITLPILFTEGINIRVDWGDNSGVVNVTTQQHLVHTYVLPRVMPYIISISGRINAWSFANPNVTVISRSSITSIGTYGCLLDIGNTGSQFKDCTRLSSFPTVDKLPLPANCSSMFEGCLLLNTNLNTLVTTNVTTMLNMFNGCSLFNGSITNWNVQSVTNMSGMFENCERFIGNVFALNDENSVTTMLNMFRGCTAFIGNNNLLTWDVQGVENMSGMFENCSTSFTGANLFALQAGNVVDTMANMFSGCTAFIGNNLLTWNVQGVENMSGMFANCSTSFTGANLFALTNINPQVTTMLNMFSGCTNFTGNTNLSNWDVSKVQNMTGIFTDCTAFRTDISKWIFTAITDNRAPTFSTAYLDEVRPLFSEEYQNEASWKFSSATNDNILNAVIPADRRNLYRIIQADQSVRLVNIRFISTWTINAGLLFILPIVTGTQLQITVDWGDGQTDKYDNNIRPFHTYDNPGPKTITIIGRLPGWSFGSVTTSRELLKSITQYGGLELDTTGGSQFKSCTNLETFPTFGAGVAQLTLPAICTSMFEGCTLLNTDLRTLNTANVTNMLNMFNGCTRFNGDISNWNVSTVTNMTDMFFGCDDFRKDISQWVLTGITFNQVPSFSPQYIDEVKPLFSAEYPDAWTFTTNNNQLINIINVIPPDQRNLYSTRQVTGFIKLERNPFVSTWRITANDTQITLPINVIADTNIRVDWGDPAGDFVNVNTGVERPSYTYVAQRDYTIRISGRINEWSFANLPADNVSRSCITSIVTYGCLLDIRNTGFQFENCTLLTSFPAEGELALPLDCHGMFSGCTGLTEPEGINTLNTSNVTDMNGMFNGCTNFNGNLLAWNVQNVNDMTNMFFGCQAFTGGDAAGTRIFSIPALNNEVSMQAMFAVCTLFNGDISGWNVQNVTNMSGMFTGCENFNGNLLNWNVQNVSNMDYMFGATDITDIPSPGCVRFTGFNPADGTRRIFDITALNAAEDPVPRSMVGMFNGCSTFNGDISVWDVERVTNMAGIFTECTAFRRDVSNWRLNGITGNDGANLPSFSNEYIAAVKPLFASAYPLAWTFANNLAAVALAAIIPAGSRDSYTVINLSLQYALPSFESTWSVENETVTLPISIGTYINIAVDWGDGDIIPYNFTIDINGSNRPSHVYTGASQQRQITVTGELPNWSFENDKTSKDLLFSIDKYGGLEIAAGGSQFKDCTSLTRFPIVGELDLPVVCQSMFSGCTGLIAALGINTLNTSAVTDMSLMFSGCSLFNGDISDWDVRTVTNMTGIFTDCTAFRTDISKWIFTAITNNRAPTFSAAYIDDVRPLFSDADEASWKFSSATNGNILNAVIPADRQNLYRIIQEDQFVRLVNTPFISTWTITAGLTCTLPIILNTEFHITVDWGDGQTDKYDNNRPFHTYLTPGDTRTITIIGRLPGWSFGSVTTSRELLKSITQYGGLELDTTGGSHFLNCINLETFPTFGAVVAQLTLPAICTSMFEGCTLLNTDLRTLNTANVTNMLNMFKGCTRFNGDISNWTVQRVSDMSGMFANCLAFTGEFIFNIPIGFGFLNMSNMFSGCSLFNGDISDWDVKDVTDMSAMFFNCEKFTGEHLFAIPKDLSDLKLTNSMFSGCKLFIGNANLSTWDVKDVTDMTSMFFNCEKFTGEHLFDIPDGSDVTLMNSMFSGCKLFTVNDKLSTWNVRKVTNMANIFEGCTLFSTDISKWVLTGITANNRAPSFTAEYIDVVKPKFSSAYRASWKFTASGAVNKNIIDNILPANRKDKYYMDNTLRLRTVDDKDEDEESSSSAITGSSNSAIKYAYNSRIKIFF